MQKRPICGRAMVISRRMFHRSLPCRARHVGFIRMLRLRWAQHVRMSLLQRLSFTIELFAEDDTNRRVSITLTLCFDVYDTHGKQSKGVDPSPASNLQGPLPKLRECSSIPIRGDRRVVQSLLKDHTETPPYRETQNRPKSIRKSVPAIP